MTDWNLEPKHWARASGRARMGGPSRPLPVRLPPVRARAACMTAPCRSKDVIRGPSPRRSTRPPRRPTSPSRFA
eukprot:4074784-Pyramimonas_sp.AAC.1